MRLSKEVLLEIVAIVQDGLMYGRDVSQDLRRLDLAIGIEELVLSKEYIQKYPRATVWPDETDDVHETDAVGDGSLS